jgi:hypothetical protein
MKRDKIKDMIRSVLPSTARKGAREAKTARKRYVRRRVRLDLHAKDFDESNADFLRDVRLSHVVWMRRGADKLNSFLRWCEARTKGMDADEALGYVRAVLPSSVIGDHAYLHWEQRRKPRPYNYGYLRPNPNQSLQSFVDSMTFRLRRALAIAPDLHQALNAEIKERKVEGEPRRLLRGLHDVEAFVREVAWPDKRGADPYYIERGVALDMNERVEKGGREAALQFFARFLPLREKHEQQCHDARQSLDVEDRPLRGDGADHAGDHDEAEEEDFDHECAVVRHEPPDQPRRDERVVQPLIGRQRSRILRALRREPEHPPPHRLRPEERLQDEEADMQHRHERHQNLGHETCDPHSASALRSTVV